jgi:broad specificity phosphatase PhoE
MGDIYLYSWSKYPDIYHEWVKHEEDIPYPNGENGNMVWERCKDSLYKMLKDDFKQIAIIAHGGKIRSIICGILNIPQEKRFYIGFPPENCSISIIKYENNHFYLHTFNDYSHL